MASSTKCKKQGKTRSRVTRRCRKKCNAPKHRKPHSRKCVLACHKGEERKGAYNHCRRKCKRSETRVTRGRRHPCVRNT